MRIKYPRTMHHPLSLGVASDDKVIASLDRFDGAEVVITEKMDGENTTVYNDGVHARSIDSRHHDSRNWVKSFAAMIGSWMAPNERICGENLFAKHSIGYDNLESYFYGFSYWTNDPNVCHSWDETVEYFELLGVTPVPVLYRGQYSEQVLNQIISDIDPTKQEGFVVRLAGEIAFDDFDKSVFKWVRQNHVQTDIHWMHQQIVQNGIVKTE